jgi:hypothetical protein
VRLHDDVSELVVGAGGTESLGAFGGLLKVGRQGERFTLESGAESINGEPVESRLVLRSGDRIESSGTVVLFWDPLEELLDELDPPESVEPTVPAIQDTADSSPNPQPVVPEEPEETPKRDILLEVDSAPHIQNERGLGILEVALVMFSIAAFGTAVAILWVVFG